MSDLQSSSPEAMASASIAVRHAVLVLRHNLNLLRISLLNDDLPGARRSFATLQGIVPVETKAVEVSAQEIRAGGCAYVDLYRALQEGRLPEARRAYFEIESFLYAHPPVHRRHLREERFDAYVEAPFATADVCYVN